MSEHYYSKAPSVKSTPQQWQAFLRGQSLTFQTDAGVFSKKELDFGSRLLIESFELPTIEGPLADIGCGYGPIGLSIAKESPEREVVLVDVNERALDLARLNAKNNQITNAIILQSEALVAVKQKDFSSILTNPPIRAGKKVVFSFYEQAFEKLCSLGSLWVVIQKKQGAPSTEKKLQELFGNVDVMAKEKGYLIFRAVKD